MKRRAVLGGAAAGAGLLACPSWIARAFAQAAGAASLVALSDAYRRAQRTGRPLLVLVIPEPQSARWPRAAAFGELLNHGGDEVLADLALAEVACATMTTLRTLVPQAGSGEPLMVLVEPASMPATTRALDAPLPTTTEPSSMPAGTSWEERAAREDAVVDQRIAVLSRLVHGALAPDAATISRRAAVARAHLSDQERALVAAAIDVVGRRPRDTTSLAPEHALRGERFPRELAALAPALIAEAAVSRPALRAVLVELGTERWRRGRIPGSRWAVSGGCGVQVEETEEERRAGTQEHLMVDCGMGHVPERSARFLDWYTSS